MEESSLHALGARAFTKRRAQVISSTEEFAFAERTCGWTPSTMIKMTSWVGIFLKLWGHSPVIKYSKMP